MGSPFAPATRPRLIEPENVPEFFVTDVPGIEISGGLVRLAFSSERYLTFADAAPSEREAIIRVRLVMPLACRQRMTRQVTEAVEDRRAALREAH